MAEKPNISVADLVRINSIEDPRISPDGQWVAFVRVQLDREKNVYLRNVWLASVDGSQLYALTTSGKDTQPRWSPDGRSLAVTSGRADKSQIYVYTIGRAGDPRKLTSLANGANNAAWSPDGSKIAFLSVVSADDRVFEDDPENATKLSDEDEKKKTDPRVIRVMPYRSGVSYHTDKYAQVYVVSASPETTDAPRRLTNHDLNYGEPAWSPDGEYLYTSRAEKPGSDEPGRNSRAYKIRVSDGVQERITDGSAYASDRAVPSADGRYLAFFRFPNEKMALRYSLLAVMDTKTGSIRDVNINDDLAPSAFAWGGNTLYFAAQWQGAAAIYQVDPAAGALRPVVEGDFRAERFSLSDDGTIAFAPFSGETLCELYIQTPDGERRQLTHFNQKLREEVGFGTFHPMQWTVDGVTINGWYLLPADFDAAKKYPLVLDIHGGPHIMWSPHYEGEWVNWQTLAAAGYVVFFANPRGSVGYGEAFQQAIGGKWGDLAYDDIMAGFEDVLKLDFIDSERLFIMGGSYGGYMTAWTIARDHRFKAAIAERGVYNLLSFTGTTDIPSFVRDEFGFELTENPQFLWENSPVAHAHKIRTPLLIIHSENDFRVAISEGEQLFALTRRNGLPVEFVRYPREGHELSRAGEPEHRIDRLNRIIGWFDRYAKSDNG